MTWRVALTRAVALAMCQGDADALDRRLIEVERVVYQWREEIRQGMAS